MKNKHVEYLLPMELEERNQQYKFPQNTIEECKSHMQYPRLEVYEDMNFGILNIMRVQEGTFVLRELNFFLTKENLILVSKEKLKVVEEFIENSNHLPCKSLYLLFEKIISNNHATLNEIEKDIVALEEKVMLGNHKNEDFTRKIVDIKKELLMVKNHFEPLVDIVEILLENDNQLIEENSLISFNNLAQKIHRLYDNVLHLRDYVSQVREAYQSQIDINLNKTMEFFTVIATIFMPLTLITGWYGMNFQYMPELTLKQGYPFVITLSLSIVLGALFFLKRKKYF